MTVQDLAAKTLVALRWLYFAQIKNERANIYAIDFMAHRGLADFFMRYRTAPRPVYSRIQR